MPGRRFIAEDQIPGHYQGLGFVRRREILRETVSWLADHAQREHSRVCAARNLERWRQAAQPAGSAPRFRVIQGDWGQVTNTLTQQYGQTFAVINMANAYVPGGGYVEGCPAQEENMFRRTDCHFSITDNVMVSDIERYQPARTELINGVHGRVYLDVAQPRICVRGPEDRDREDLGYTWLEDAAIFAFYELRAAAQDLRNGAPFDPVDAERRITAQLDTLIDANVRHAVLSAFGCGAFRNPAAEVATLYRKALMARREAFECVAFAIFYPGYGPDNFSPFRDVFEAP